jgi:serine/threonine protein kinase
MTQAYGSTAQRVGNIVGGKYRLTRRLGEGGMGEVFEAQHTLIGRRFAVKFLHAHLAKNAEAMTRFRHEAQAAGGIEHENIGAALDFGEADDGTPYLVMEYLEGQDLAHLLAEGGPLPYTRATYLILQACRGLVAAHGRGIVHRDLKPENLFLCKRDDGGDLMKVVDFGIAKLRAKVTVTQSGVTMGTPCYMSLEQARGAKEVDHRADIYALGVILYEAISGTRPYPGDNYNEVLFNLFSTEPVPLHELCPDLPAGLTDVVHRAMAREQRNRYDSVADLAMALAPFTGRALTPVETIIEQVEDGPHRGATLKSPVGLTALDTTPRPVPVTITPQRRVARMRSETEQLVETVVPGRTRGVVIASILVGIVLGPLAYGAWVYWKEAAAPVAGPPASARRAGPSAATPATPTPPPAGPAAQTGLPATPPVALPPPPAPARALAVPTGGAPSLFRTDDSTKRSTGKRRSKHPAASAGSLLPSAFTPTPAPAPKPAEAVVPASPKADSPPEPTKRHRRSFDLNNPYGE